MTQTETHETPTTETAEITEEQRAQAEAWLRAHSYGEQDENGIDISLLRSNLRRTPKQRWQLMKREMVFFQNARIIRRSA